MGRSHLGGGLRDLAKTKTLNCRFGIVCLVLTWLLAGAAHAQDVLDQAKQLMKERKPAAAFALLAPLEPRRAGEVDFDYTLGTAALDAGHPDRATIAFERVLATDPNFAGARLDLARAYFAMGSDDLAKAELQTVLQQNPPQNVRPLIAKYLEAIEARRKKQQPALVGYLEAGGGTDSNITAVTSNFTGAVLQAYNIPQVQPTGNSIKREGAFSQAGAGADYSVPLKSGFGLYVGGDLRDRHYYNNNANFNYQQYDTRGGASYTLEQDVFRAGVQSQNYYQEAATPINAATGTRITNDRRTSGYTAEWRHVLKPGRQFGLFMQSNQQRFLTNAPQNINQNLYGGQFINAWEMKWNPLLMLAAYQSRDRALGPQNIAGTTDVSKTLTGLRLYGQVTPWERLDVFASVGNTKRDDNSAFSRSTVIDYGHDRTFDLTLGLNWRVMPSWTVRAQAAYFENRSNIGLYEYTRSELSVFMRRDFK